MAEKEKEIDFKKIQEENSNLKTKNVELMKQKKKLFKHLKKETGKCKEIERSLQKSDVEINELQ